MGVHRKKTEIFDVTFRHVDVGSMTKGECIHLFHENHGRRRVRREYGKMKTRLRAERRSS